MTSGTSIRFNGTKLITVLDLRLLRHYLLDRFFFRKMALPLITEAQKTSRPRSLHRRWVSVDLRKEGTGKRFRVAPGQALWEVGL